MFGNKSQKIQDLENLVQKLSQKTAELQQTHEKQIQLLRQQLATLVTGIAPSPQSILQGLPYSELPKEKVLSFIQSIPNLLILDVRGDEGWNSGHIPQAKHIAAAQVFQRLDELSDKNRPILTFCANGNTAVTVCQLLAREGYTQVFNALGGMAGYSGPIEKPEIQKIDALEIKGSDRSLIQKIVEVVERDIRPGLKRDGGDLKILSVESGVVKIKMAGACVGCGAQKRTVESGIKVHLMKLIPEVQNVEEL